MMKRIAAMLLLIAITVPLLAGFTYSPQQTLLTGDIYQVAVNLKVPTNNDIIWSLKKDGGNVNIPDHIQGSLGNTGGSISFMQNGYYTLTASVTDAAGRKFEKSSSVTVYTDPLLNCNFSVLSANQHISKNFVINIDAAANTGGKTISWSLTKSGVTKSYTGSLSNSGGSIRVSETGTFTLTSTITDSRGRTSTCSNNFTVYNNAPATPVISRTPGDSVINCNDQIRITATASDPDGDGVTLVWDNRPSEYATYAQGVHTVRVKARDSYGLESGWASTTLTSALLYQSGYIIPASAGMGLYIDAPV